MPKRDECDHSDEESTQELPKRAKLGNTSKWRPVPLRQVGVKLSDSVVRFAPADLERSDLPPDMDGVFGLEEIRQQLVESILLPLTSPHVFRIDSRAYDGAVTMEGSVPLELALSFYGARGSGKKTAVRTFCKQHCITLFEVSYTGFQPETDIELAYKDAAEPLPAIVLFNECEGFFPDNLHAPGIGKLHGRITSVRQSHVPVWTVFASAVNPLRQNVFHHFIRSEISHYRWSGKLNASARERAFRQAVTRYLHHEQRLPLTDTFVSTMKQLSDYCTVGEIYTYVERVFRLRAKICVRDVAVLTPDSERLVPTPDDFRQCLVTIPSPHGTMQRITNTDPRSVNVAPYSDKSEEPDHGWGS